MKIEYEISIKSANAVRQKVTYIKSHLWICKYNEKLQSSD